MSKQDGFFFFAFSVTIPLISLWLKKSAKKISESPKREKSKTAVLEVPTIEFNAFVNKATDGARYLEECQKVAFALHKYGLCIVRDARVKEEDNHRFLDMMENYFEFSDGVRDARPEHHYQVGVTPEGVGNPFHIKYLVLLC